MESGRSSIHSVNRKGGIAIYQYLKKAYKEFYPFSSLECSRKAGEKLLTIGFLQAAGTMAVFLFVDGYLKILLAALFSYVIFCEGYQWIYSYEKQKMDRDFVKLLSSIRHQYYRSMNVVDAVKGAAEGVGKAAARQLGMMYDILSGEDKEEEMLNYKKIVANRFYQMLVTQLATVDEHGDELWEDGKGSALQHCLGSLRREVEQESRRYRQQRHLLAGLGLVIIVPVFTIPAIRQWATGNLPELTSFYYGAAGRCMELVILAATFYTYRMLGEWKGRKYQPIFLPAVKHLANRTYLLEHANKYWSPKQEKKKKLVEKLEKVGDHRTAEEFFLYQCFCVLFAESMVLVVYALFVRFGELHPAVWCTAVVFVPMIAYWQPFWRIFLERLFMTDRRREEVLRFQFVLALEKKLPGITTCELLQHITEQASLFRTSLLKCMGDYEQGEREAFLALWQREDYIPFLRIVDMFLMAEETGVADAFDEVEADIEEFRENRKLETEIFQHNMADLAMLAACIPGILLLFGYLIIPFMTECFRMLEHYNSNIMMM